MYAEAKRKSEWLTVGSVFPGEFYRADELTYMHTYPGSQAWETNKRWSMHPYDARNYSLFAVLADVRNSHGFTPIDQPRGIPEDVSKYLKSVVEDWEYSGHSFSWLGLSELEEYDWEQPNTHSGVVTVDGFREFMTNGRPSSWSRSAAGGNIVVVDNDEMRAIVNGEVPRFGGTSYYTSITWNWPVSESTGDFVNGTIPLLREVRDKKDVEDVRIVFWFDS
ncbi:hypothetical protein FHT44_004965 [Mycolicibacterium sp. BK634]|uniref:hypothetical protein n=1 Tax=Mycolicibacterium sp. BK634 TaxID=2587099 RepID=UPI00161FB437|nr:hypothetical protein [Mycolicibacterium sp. BK634]MBB3752453.1 hypothetical protein [Mycolicibacterium sp. BK634]